MSHLQVFVCVDTSMVGLVLCLVRSGGLREKHKSLEWKEGISIDGKTGDNQDGQKFEIYFP